MNIIRRGGFGCTVVALMAAFLLLMAVPFVPQTSAAENTSIDLSLGGSGGTPWTVSNVKPGDFGSETVELTNLGTVDGYVMIWISDIVETDGSDDGAALSDYFLLTMEAAGLTSNVSFPALLYDLPDTPSDANNVVIEGLAGGSSVLLTWDWEFHDNGQPQNEAQGDGLSFTINYLLAESVPNQEVTWMIVDVLGKQTVVSLDNDGFILDPVKASDAYGVVSLVFPEGVQILTEDGFVPSKLVLSAYFDHTPELNNVTRASVVYRLTGDLDREAVEVNFSRPAGLIVGVDPYGPLNQAFGVKLYQLEDGNWTQMPDAGTATSWEAHALIKGTGLFVAAYVENDPEEAFVYASDLALKLETHSYWWPLTIVTVRGSSVEITAVVTNDGQIAGNITLSLWLDGKTVDVRVIELGAGESRTVTYELNDLSSGAHQVRVGGLEDSFRTSTGINWLLIIVLLIITVAIILLVWYVLKRRGNKRGDNRYLIT